MLRVLLADYLFKNHILCTKNEAEVMAEIVLDLDNDNSNDDNHIGIDKTIFSTKKDILIENLVENLDIEEDQARNVVLNLQQQHRRLHSSDSSSCSGEDSQEDNNEVNIYDENEESLTFEKNYNDKIEEKEAGYLIDGECELCDRCIKLTKHHLIPKSTWPKIQTKLLHAADAKAKGDIDKARLIVGSGLEDVFDRIVCSDKKTFIRTILHGTTCHICRQCHTTIHKTHTNIDLALHFNSVEKLLNDTKIFNFCRWASKQKPGKYSRS